jgi:hypothetical protein
MDTLAGASGSDVAFGGSRPPKPPLADTVGGGTVPDTITGGSGDDADNNGRTPTKKRRGRPPVWMNRLAMAKQVGFTRHQADMTSAALAGLAPGLHDRWLPLLDKKETTFTIIGCVARFPHERQEQMFEHFQGIGTRAAKRFVECMRKPPARGVVAKRTLAWLLREFPTLSMADLLQGMELLVYGMRRAEDAEL